MKNFEVLYGLKQELPNELFSQAIDLRTRIYKEVGFISKEKSKDYSTYDNKAIHFLALDDGKVIGYIRLLFEMPLLDLYEKEVTIIKTKNNFIKSAEISRFVVDRGYRIDEKEIEEYEKFVSFLLFKKVYEYIFKNNIDSVFIVVHPKYKERYERFYHFKQFGEEKLYNAVEGNPAVLLYQNVLKAAEWAKEFSKTFYEFMSS
jgi:N-acyl-L-homoserine lactone synthetase